MRRLLLLAAALLTFGGSPAPEAGHRGVVAVYLDGVDAERGGRLVVRLFRAAEGFPADRERAEREVTTRVQSSAATVLVEDVPAGPVAVAAFHDADGDGRVRLSDEGLPLEGVAALDLPADRSRPPSWGRSAFAHDGDRVSVVRLRVRYP